MTAHVAGVPVEELLLPLLAGGTATLVVAARAALRRVTHRSDRTAQSGEGEPSGRRTG